MKQKVFSFFFCVILLASCLVTASADSDLPMVIDNAGLLSGEERNELEKSAQTLRSEYEMDVVILTINSLGRKSAQAYADDYYDENGYGYGEQYSGLLFLLAMDEREWYISTCGEAIYVFTDYGLDQLGDSVVPYLSSGAYYEAFTTYLSLLPSYWDAYAKERPIDGYTGNPVPAQRTDVVYYRSDRRISIGLSLGVGLFAAVVVILIMCVSMNTKRGQSSAGNYIKTGSYHLKVQRDLFLYSNLSKVRRQENNGGGGSSTHRSSGGRSHGGRGGRF